RVFGYGRGETSLCRSKRNVWVPLGHRQERFDSGKRQLYPGDLRVCSKSLLNDCRIQHADDDDGGGVAIIGSDNLKSMLLCCCHGGFISIFKRSVIALFLYRQNYDLLSHDPMLTWMIWKLLTLAVRQLPEWCFSFRRRHGDGPYPAVHMWLHYPLAPRLVRH